MFFFAGASLPPDSCRLGEADNPGPQHLISVGTSNPSGLRNKEQLAVDFGPGIWQFSETQLSAVSLPVSSRAIKSFSRVQHRDVRIFAGAPAPLRPGSQFAGTWTGVLTMSDYPCRPLQLQWLHDSFHTGRIQALHHFINDVPVITANLYGFPPGKTYVDARVRTERLLETLTHELVLGRKGVRLISGDFNHWHDQLDQIKLWKQQGWIEAQELAAHRWQQAPAPTCKGSTHRDFIFLSPEAAALCDEVRLVDTFAEHSTVIAGLRLTGVHRVQSWPLPAVIPWQSVDVSTWQKACAPMSIQESCSTRWLSAFAKGFECSLDGFVQTAPACCLPQRCYGRARRLSPDVPPNVTPSKPARPGEEAVHHDLLSLEVKRWYQQLRRLQSLDHAMRAGNQSPSAIEHRLGLWRSIRSAKGFRPDFLSWWPNRPVQLAGSPSRLTLHLPAAQVCHFLFLDFRDNFRKFEAWHVRQRKAILAEQYAHNRNLLFRDLREPKPEQADTLVLQRTYSVLAVDPPTCAVHLDDVIDDRGCSQWQLDGCTVQVTSVSGDVCCISDCPSLQVDAELEQTIFLSSAEHVQHEFEKLWSSFWTRHTAPATADWSRIVSFAKAYLPQGRLDLPPLSLDVWRRALKRFKPRAARGPDGISKLDLLNMSDAHTCQLLDFLSDIESGRRPWPAQWLVGLICCLKKPNERYDPQGYRPICLFSCIYRAWSGLRARQVLRWLRDSMPATALGFMPHREAAQFWWLLEAQIEYACQHDVPLTGYCTDVMKAFNALPREPVFVIAKWIGLPPTLLDPWQSFLGGLERRFMIRSSVGAPLRSSCGFPEGCALSTVGMSLICLCYHKYVEAFSTGATPHSYVDNLSCTARTVGQLVSGINVSNTFLDMLHLDADQTKTYAWALHSRHRAALANVGLKVQHHSRELGGVVSFSRATHNAELVNRCKSLSPLFGRLRRSPCSLVTKLSVLPLRFWAFALHGVSGCPLAEVHLSTLRAQAVRALGCQSAGVSSMLRLSTCANLEVDPGFYQLWSIIRDLRRLASKEPSVLTLWAEFMIGYDGTLFHGPFSKLLQVFAQIGWHIDIPPNFVDHDGLSHDLLSMPLALLRRRCEQAWLNHVACAHRHRNSMHDLDGLDLALLQADSNKLSALEHALLAALRSGAYMFGALHSRYDLSQDGLCKHCGVADTHEHRVCHCPLFAQVRAPYNWVCDVWQTLPECLRTHLLPPANPHLLRLQKCLAALPDVSDDFASLQHSHGFQHLFCDGSCLLTAHHDFALAAWATVNASTGDALACGPVPGLVQTSPRAELWGAIASLKWGLRTGTSIALWTDSDQVGRGLQRMLDGTFHLPLDNSDLWTLLSDLAEAFLPGTLLVQHVPSHLNPALGDSPFEDWAIAWNHRADVLAGVANINRPYELQVAHEAAFSWHNKHADIIRALRGIYFGIAAQTKSCDRARTLVIDCEVPDPEPTDVDLTPEHGFEDALPLTWKLLARQACTDVPAKFVDCLCDFLLTQSQCSTSWRELSWLELVFLVKQHPGLRFPVRSLSSNKWQDADDVPLGAPSLTVAVQLRVVRNTFRGILAAIQRCDLLVEGLSLIDLGEGGKSIMNQLRSLREFNLAMKELIVRQQ
ncbi:unnamed protein product, partial [Symbiodinium microadriaticum]